MNWRGMVLPPESLTWASSNPAVATVSSTGLVAATAAGTVSIVASYKGAAARRAVIVAGAAPITGLQVYFPFSGNAVDASGHGHDGTVFGATLTADRHGTANSAFWFDGGTAYIESDAYDFVGAFTVTAWVRPEMQPNGRPWGSIVGKFTLPGNVELNINDITSQVVLHTESTTGLFTPGSLAADQWYFLAATYDGASLARIYVNGVLAASGTGLGPAPSTTIPLRIGRPAWGGNSFKGTIDEVRIYDSALSGAQVWALYMIP